MPPALTTVIWCNGGDARGVSWRARARPSALGPEAVTWSAVVPCAILTAGRRPRARTARRARVRRRRKPGLLAVRLPLQGADRARPLSRRAPGPAAARRHRAREALADAFTCGRARHGFSEEPASSPCSGSSSSASRRRTTILRAPVARRPAAHALLHAADAALRRRPRSSAHRASAAGEPSAPARVACCARRAARRVMCLGLAALATASWLLTGVNSDGSSARRSATT